MVMVVLTLTVIVAMVTVVVTVVKARVQKNISDYAEDFFVFVFEPFVQNEKCNSTENQNEN